MKTEPLTHRIPYWVFPWALLAALVCLPLNLVAAQEAGQQVLIAGSTPTAPELDGVLSPEEWQAAVPFYVDFTQPKSLPGIITGGGDEPGFTASSPEDLSYTLHAMYDDMYLYVGVDVTDEALWNDSAVGDRPWATWEDDSVDLFIDGDGVYNDHTTRNSNREGFQLSKVWNGPSSTFSEGLEDQWAAESGDRPDGYVVEFRIALEAIDMVDGEGTAAPGPGDSIGFNIAVGDDDNGGKPYNEEQLNGAEGELVDSFGMWDGDWQVLIRNEEWWGTLYFQPSEGTAVESRTWGRVKSLPR